MQILVIEEKLGHEGQVLAIDWVFIAIYLKNSNIGFFVSVDLITRRMEERTSLRVSFELALQCEET